jgi:hypothetical protein
MQNPNITYQTFSPGDEEGIIELLRSVFPKWKQINNPLNYWKWKHFEKPIPSIIVVARDGDEVVGVSHNLLLDIKIGDAILRSAYGDDLAIHPDYRQLGVWTNIRKVNVKKQIEEGIKFQYLATDNPIVKENIVKMGYSPSKHYISHRLKIIDRELFLKRKQRDNLVTKVGITALTKWNEAKQFFSPEYGRDEYFSIIDVTKFDHKTDVFWENVKSSYDFCLVKNADYCNWKYSRPTISEHRIRLAMRDEEVLGFSTLSISEDKDYREGYISDLLAFPNRMDVANALISDACEHFNNEKVAAIYFQVTKGHPYESLAERNGFIDVSSQNNTYFFYLIINESIPSGYFDNLDPSKIQLTYF